MALPTVVLTGLAQFTGAAGTITVSAAAIYPLQKDYKITHVFKEQELPDPSGFDVAWSARNEYADFSIGLYLVDSSGYTSSPSAGTVDNAIKGTTFPAPLSLVTLSGFGGTHSADYKIFSSNGGIALNGVFQFRSGSDISMDNEKCGEMTWKLRYYANAAQQALMALTPTP